MHTYNVHEWKTFVIHVIKSRYGLNNRIRPINNVIVSKRGIDSRDWKVIL